MQIQSKKRRKNIAKTRCILVVYSSRCRGCGLCELICSIEHENEARPEISRIKVEKDRDNYQFKPSTCLQCINPKCLNACPTKAITIEEKSGAKIINDKLCNNCGSCREACPFASRGKTIFPHPSKTTYLKCDLCYWRENGPACIEVCPTGALNLKEIRG